MSLVAVRADARRRGIATRLLDAVETHCRTGRLFTSTNASNHAARGLFVKAGFVESGRIDNLDAADPEQVFFKAVDRPQGATG